MSKKFRLIGFLMVFIIVFISLGALSAANLNDNSSTDLGANSSNQSQVLSTVIDSNNSDNSNIVNNYTNSNLNKAVNNDNSINNSLDSSTNSTKTLNNQVSDNSNKVNNTNISTKSSTQVLKISSKPTSFSISQITSASKTVKAYYIANGKLPSTVTVGSVKLTLAQFLYYISQLNSNNKANIQIIGSLDEPSRPNSGDSVNGKLSKSAYVDSATRTYKFIFNYDQGPNYSTTTIGRVSYNRLIEAFSVVLDYYNSNNKLPSTINVKYNSKTTIPSSTPNTNTSAKSFTINQIVSASKVVKEYYDKN
ncbi:hypothetical protein [uncultured Methanobrevibacter sp.]|uniref:hypothetical protein n=1 Tax=uncultured Methanobrevibacter sp. TaxID=253161 RepID=UPI00258BC369|nr:hypothetical protein [uncultured Methanobrevibacter sp.]